MNRERIMQLAKNAGFVFWSKGTPDAGKIDWACVYDEELERFAHLIAAETREECARICMNAPIKTARQDVREACAAAIRNGGK